LNTWSTFGEYAPIDTIVAALYDRELLIQSAATDALHTLQVPLQPLISSLQASDELSPAIRAALMRTCGQQVPMNILLAALDDKDIEVQCTAMFILSAMDKQVSTGPLLTALSHRSATVRCFSIRALAGCKGLVPVEALLNMLYDRDEIVRKDAVEAVITWGEDVPLAALVDLLQDKHPWVRSSAVMILAEQGQRVPLETLLNLLHDTDARVRRQAVIALGKQGQRVPVETVLQMLDDEDEAVRCHTLKAVAALERRAPIPRLLNALHDASPKIREAAAVALHQLAEHGQEIPVGPLVAALNTTDRDTGWHIVEVLGALGVDMPIDVLVTLLGEASLCNAALEALANAGERVPVEPVLAALGNTNYHGSIRETAWDTLKKTHPDALSAVAQEAQAILLGQGYGPILGSLAQSFLADLISCVEHPSPGMFEKLHQMLYWHYWEVRQKAAETLGKIRRNIPDATVQRLMELRHDPQSRSVREATENTLTKILSPETHSEDE
jgi:HEAT repeat protein